MKKLLTLAGIVLAMQLGLGAIPTNAQVCNDIPPAKWLYDTEQPGCVILSGDRIVPDAVETEASGNARFIVDAEGSAIYYQFTVSGIENITSAGIHFGLPDSSGPMIFSLLLDTSEGTLTAKDFIPNEELVTWADAVDALLSSSAYINISSQRNPDGEIRGTIFCAQQIGAEPITACKSEPDPMCTLATQSKFCGMSPKNKKRL